MSGSLEGLLVVSMDQAVAAPFTASRLADAGARVIKVERPGGDFARRYDSVVDGQSTYFVWLNRGKESVEIDIRSEAGAALLHRLVARADVFIQNLAPGAAARAGFDSNSLRERHPRLITCDISGYGEDGPFRDMKAYDLLIQAETGLASVTGNPDAPGRVGVSVVDIAAGLYAWAGILEALYRREKTGSGSGVRVSLFDAMADWMTVPLLWQEYTGQAPARVGLAHPGIAPYSAFGTRDGRQIVIAIQNEREWERFCADILGDAALARDRRFEDNEARVRNRPALDALVGERVGEVDHDDIAARLSDAKIAWGAVNSVADLASHPQLRRVTLDTPSGPVSMPAPPLRFAGREAGLRPVPKPGEHNEAIAAEFADTGPGASAGRDGT